MAVITVSRQYGSHGEIIARAVAEKLGYEFVDKELLAEVAQITEASPSDLEAYDERGERGLRAFLRKTFLGSVAYDYTMYYPFVWGNEPPVFHPLTSDNTGSFPTPNQLLQAFNTVIKRLWERDKVVIVGRGSQVVLRDKPRTLHVRFVAPMSVRCERVMQEESLSESQARQKIEEIDKRRARYLKQYYRANWADLNLYHVVINTGLTHREAAIGLILALVGGLS